MTQPNKEEAEKEEALRDEAALHPHPEKVIDALFVENDFFDPRDLVQVKYEMLRRVDHEGKTITEAAAAFGVSRPTFYEARKAFKDLGLPGLVPKRRGPRRAHKLTDEVMEFVDTIVAASDSVDAVEISRRIQERFGKSVHPRSVERALRRKKGR